MTSLPTESRTSALAIALPPALAVAPGPKAALAHADTVETLKPGAARDAFRVGPILVAHAGMTARRLGLSPPARARDILDVLELYAFARPARFCAPSPVGLAVALGLPDPRTLEAQANAMRLAAETLLAELAAAPWPSREETLAVAETLERAGWAWGPLATQALRFEPATGKPWRSSGLDVWTRLKEWED